MRADESVPGELQRITEPALLVVEGKDDRNFFLALAKHVGLPHLQIIPLGGRNALPSTLGALCKMTTFSMVGSFGIAIDAEEDADAALQYVRRALESVGLPVPDRPLSPVGGKPQVCVLILPPGAKAGAIEDVCLKAVESDPSMKCVDGFFRCLKDRSVGFPDNISKARAQVFLASKPKAGISLGVAAQQGYWLWYSPVFDDVKHFLRVVAQPQAYQGQVPSVSSGP